MGTFLSCIGWKWSKGRFWLSTWFPQNYYQDDEIYLLVLYIEGIDTVFYYQYDILISVAQAVQQTLCSALMSGCFGHMLCSVLAIYCAVFWPYVVQCFGTPAQQITPPHSSAQLWHLDTKKQNLKGNAIFLITHHQVFPCLVNFGWDY